MDMDTGRGERREKRERGPSVTFEYVMQQQRALRRIMQSRRRRNMSDEQRERERELRREYDRERRKHQTEEERARAMERRRMKQSVRPEQIMRIDEHRRHGQHADRLTYVKREARAKNRPMFMERRRDSSRCTVSLTDIKHQARSKASNYLLLLENRTEGVVGNQNVQHTNNRKALVQEHTKLSPPQNYGRYLDLEMETQEEASVMIPANKQGIAKVFLHHQKLPKQRYSVMELSTSQLLQCRGD